MSDATHNTEEMDEIFQRSFDRGFDFGRGEEMATALGVNVSSLEMAHALHIAGAIAGLATKLADLMGESNAHFALHQAANAVTVHCAHKRAVQAAN